MLTGRCQIHLSQLWVSDSYTSRSFAAPVPSDVAVEPPEPEGWGPEQHNHLEEEQYLNETRRFLYFTVETTDMVNFPLPSITWR